MNMKALSELTKIADKLFSNFIRQRNADENGLVTCHICGACLHWKRAECSHFISRAKFRTRYDERNAHQSCHECNQIHNTDREPYSMFMLQEYPAGTIPDLMRLSMTFLSSLDKRIMLEKVIKKYK